jgi:hypothetical protein
MMIFRLTLSAVALVVVSGFIACGKEERNSGSAGAVERKDDAAAAEAEKRSAMIAELATEQQFLDMKIKAAVEKLEKQGNKTKKNLKPKFASLEAERAEVSGGLEELPALSTPDFTEKSSALRSRQDSLSMRLSVLEKSMK